MRIELVRIGVAVTGKFLADFLGDSGVGHGGVERVTKAVKAQFVTATADFSDGFEAFAEGDLCFDHDALEGFAQAASAATGFSVKGEEDGGFSVVRGWEVEEVGEEVFVDRDGDADFGFLLAVDEDHPLGEVELFPLEVGEVAQALAGVESGEDQAPPIIGWGGAQEVADLVEGEDTGFGVRFLQRFDGDAWVHRDVAEADSFVQGGREDFGDDLVDGGGSTAFVG